MANYTVTMLSVQDEVGKSEAEIFVYESVSILRYFDTLQEAQMAFDFLLTFASYEKVNLILRDEEKEEDLRVVFLEDEEEKAEEEIKEKIEILNDTEISKKFGIPTRTLQDWKNKNSDNWRTKIYQKIKLS